MIKVCVGCNKREEYVGYSLDSSETSEEAIHYISENIKSCQAQIDVELVISVLINVMNAM